MGHKSLRTITSTRKPTLRGQATRTMERYYPTKTNKYSRNPPPTPPPLSRLPNQHPQHRDKHPPRSPPRANRPLPLDPTRRSGHRPQKHRNIPIQLLRLFQLDRTQSNQRILPTGLRTPTNIRSPHKPPPRKHQDQHPRRAGLTRDSNQHGDRAGGYAESHRARCVRGGEEGEDRGGSETGHQQPSAHVKAYMYLWSDRVAKLRGEMRQAEKEKAA